MIGTNGKTVLTLALWALMTASLLAQQERTVGDSLYEAATVSHNAGDHEAALALYDRVLALDPAHGSTRRESEWIRAG